MKNIGTITILKVIFSHLRQHTALLAFVTLSVIGASTLDLVSPLLYKQFFDVIASARPTEQAAAGALIRILLMIAAIHTGSWFLWRVSGFINSWLQPALMAALERTSFSHLLGHTYGFFTNTFTGSLVRKVRRLSRAAEDILDHVFWKFLPLTIMIIGTLLALFARNRLVGFVVLAWIVLMLCINILFAIWKLKYDKEKATQDSVVTGILSDAMSNHTNIQLFTGRAHEEKLFASAIERLRRLRTFTWFLGDGVAAVQALFMLGVEFAILYFGIKLWTQGVLTVGDFALFQGYLLVLFHRFWDLDREVRQTYEAFADASEMVEILETPHAIVDAHAARPLRVKDGRIAFENVVFHYNKTRRVLNHLNLTIAPGEKVALVGPSGAGKSTLVKLLLRLHDIEEGEILIDGQSVARVTQDSLRRHIALVPQDPVLFHRTLEENIRYGKRHASMKEIMAASKKARCHDFIKDLPEGYQTFVGERGIKLSGGERQRVAIARAILADTPILVLDEATSSLDSHSESLIQDALRELMKNKTVIVIAHRLSTILEMDRIVVLDHGRVVDEGTHKQLLETDGLYKNLWEIQAGGFLA